MGYKYDVVLSFAGEDREYVEKVTGYLNDHGIKFFYDKFPAPVPGFIKNKTAVNILKNSCLLFIPHGMKHSGAIINVERPIFHISLGNTVRYLKIM